MAQQQQTAVVEHGREPCPDRILDDIGGAFGMGAIGGGLWHTFKGLKNSPKGYKIYGTLDVSRRGMGTKRTAWCVGPLSGPPAMTRSSGCDADNTTGSPQVGWKLRQLGLDVFCV